MMQYCRNINRDMWLAFYSSYQSNKHIAVNVYRREHSSLKKLRSDVADRCGVSA